MQSIPSLLRTLAGFGTSRAAGIPVPQFRPIPSAANSAAPAVDQVTIGSAVATQTESLDDVADSLRGEARRRAQAGADRPDRQSLIEHREKRRDALVSKLRDTSKVIDLRAKEAGFSPERIARLKARQHERVRAADAKA